MSGAMVSSRGSWGGSRRPAALDHAGLGLGHAAQHLEQRGLARRCGRRADPVAGAHGEAGTLDHEGAADLDREPANRQHGGPWWQGAARDPPHFRHPARRRAPNHLRHDDGPGNSAALPTSRSRGARSQTRTGPALERPGDDDLIRAGARGPAGAGRSTGATPGPWAVARRVCNDRVLAEDVSQTVFTDLWRRPGRFDPDRGRLRPWLVAQAHARAVDTVRLETARQRRQDREGQLAPVTEHDGGHRPRRRPGRRRAPRSTSCRRRAEAIVLSYFGGHSYRDGRDAGRPEGTVKTRIRRASGLRRALEARG